MICRHMAWPSDREYLQRFRRKVTEQRIPLSGSIDLTHRCNLRCVHCYLGDQESISKKRDQELSADQWITIIDEITEAGCLYLLITGGDPLLRKDFSRIYRYAKLNGLLVTVFTNGTMVTDDLLQIFKELPPQAVEISLYGSTFKTYEQITGIKGSYARCINGIESLLDIGVRVRLKTILMTLNSHEFYAIEEIARDYGVPFRFDAAIFAKFNNDRFPLQLRVSAEEAIEKEFSDPARKKKLLKYYQRMLNSPVADTVYTCGTGVSSFHINAFGFLQPCLMVTTLQYNLAYGKFISGWENVLLGFREKKMKKNNPCRNCSTMPLCGYCPPAFELENGSEENISSFACKMGQLRLQQLNNLCA